MSVGALVMLQIERDAHCRGGEPIKPWAARIAGPSAKFGLQREFVRPMNDWANASRAYSGNLYGVVSMYPLREGALYEVQRGGGKPSKRHIVREFLFAERGKLRKRTAEEALAHADGDDRPAVSLLLEDSREAPSRVARVTGLGTPTPKAFVVQQEQRLYRLHVGDLYEVQGVGARGRKRGPFVGVDDDGELVDLDEKEALAWLARK